MEENKMQVEAVDTTNNSVFEAYDLKVHRWGRVSLGLAIITMFLPIIGVCLYYGVGIDWGALGVAVLAVWAAFGVNGLIEPFTFAPILGAGATYIAFTTGNVSQTKVPCAVSAQEIMGVEMGTKEGDVVATLAVGTCSLITTLEVALGMIFVNLIYPVLTSPVLSPGFNNVLPALLGAMLVMRWMTGWKVAVLPIVVDIVLLLVMGQAWGSTYGIYIMLFLIAITLAWSYHLFKKGKIK